jgi:hypothetical protein
MTSVTEKTETAETSATKKPRVAPRRANVAPAKPKSGKKTAPAKKAAKARTRANVSKPGVRSGTKTAKVLDLLKRPGGATAKELLKATGWQAHSLRGFIKRPVGQEDGADGHVREGRGRRADLLREGLSRQSSLASRRWIHIQRLFSSAPGCERQSPKSGNLPPGPSIRYVKPRTRSIRRIITHGRRSPYTWISTNMGRVPRFDSLAVLHERDDQEHERDNQAQRCGNVAEL